MQLEFIRAQRASGPPVDLPVCLPSGVGENFTCAFWAVDATSYDGARIMRLQTHTDWITTVSCSGRLLQIVVDHQQLPLHAGISWDTLTAAVQELYNA